MMTNGRLAAFKNGRLKSESARHLDQVEQLLFSHPNGSRGNYVCMECCRILSYVTSEGDKSRSLGIEWHGRIADCTPVVGNRFWKCPGPIPLDQPRRLRVSKQFEGCRWADGDLQSIRTGEQRVSRARQGRPDGIKTVH